jgi:asparagine synthase (glutamine-hydrolysing)
MCGIAGYFAKGIQQSIAGTELPKALDRIAHRGPDGRGTWLDPAHGVGLGHVRLAILDVGDTAKQPMLSQNGRWAMVFNGEVYNFAEIRGRLEAQGIEIRSSGDSLGSTISFAISHSRSRRRQALAFCGDT